MASAFLAVAVSAQQTPPPAFRFERPIVTGGAGPRRLTIDVPLLAGGAPFRVVSRSAVSRTGTVVFQLADGLRDLRLYDSAGREIGYLLVGIAPPEPVYQAATILPVSSVDTDTARSSGFEADLGAMMTVDRFRVDGLRPPFLKRMKLEASGDREHWTMLVAEGTLFDLPEESLQQIELRFRSGPYRYFRVTWDDTNSGRVPRPPSAAAGRLPPDTLQPPPLVTPLVFERRPSEPGRSRFRIRLPGGHLPIVMLQLDIGGGHILRRAKLYEARLSGSQLLPVLLGQATLKRVVRGELSAAELRIGVDPPTEAQLDLEVDDGDNPPLDLRGVSAEFVPLPWIYLESPADAVTARYGNATLTAPRYDLEAARAQIRMDGVTDATWGEPRARNADDNATAAPPLPTVGTSLDPSLFRYVRGVPAGSPGLLSIGLDAPVLAHSTGADRGFADLRIVDAADRQIPYIVEQAAEPLSLDVAIEKISPPKTLSSFPRTRGNRSVYRIKYPADTLPASRLVLSTTARVFERRVTIAQEREPDGTRRDAWIEPLADASWISADQGKPSMPLTLAIPARVGRRQATRDVPAEAPAGPSDPSVLLIVDEGDNTALPIEKASVLLPAYRVRLFRDANAHLRMAYGRDDLARPQYDLALLTPQLLGTPATEVTLDPEKPADAAAPAAALMSPRLFWAALGIAVVVLLGLIGRLLRKESAP